MIAGCSRSQEESCNGVVEGGVTTFFPVYKRSCRPHLDMKWALARRKPRHFNPW